MAIMSIMAIAFTEWFPEPGGGIVLNGGCRTVLLAITAAGLVELIDVGGGILY